MAETDRKESHLRYPLYKKEKITTVILICVSLILLLLGWRLFWFLTDDAFIAFRYVSNSLLGHGYVWNPPPFLPVEGYTSFFWVLSLDILWRILHVSPPQSANLLALGFASVTVIVSIFMVLWMDLKPGMDRYRILFAGLVVFGALSNRTFLAWTSSGLETAAFNFFLTLWVFIAIYFTPTSWKWIFSLGLAASMANLTRPDGILLVIATCTLATIGTWNLWRTETLRAIYFVALFPLLIVPVHLLWRYSYYGEWLPNTFFAKMTGQLHPESGTRYLLSFIIEYSIWIWFLILMIVVVKCISRRWLSPSRGSRITHFDLSSIVEFVVVVSLFFQFTYYTFVIGGDHFEYRVYSHLIPLILVSFVWMLNFLNIKSRYGIILLILFIGLSWPIPWSHWLKSQSYNTRRETGFMKISVAEEFEERFKINTPIVTNYLQYYDQLQFWLIDRAVCMRHQEHKVFYLHMSGIFPERDFSVRQIEDQSPVTAFTSVGVIGWVYPHLNIIDLAGLNDYIIARNPDLIPRQLMAHERKPPPGYLECFSIEVASKVTYIPEDQIAKCETIFRNWLQGN